MKSLLTKGRVKSLERTLSLIRPLSVLPGTASKWSLYPKNNIQLSIFGTIFHQNLKILTINVSVILKIFRDRCSSLTCWARETLICTHGFVPDISREARFAFGRPYHVREISRCTSVARMRKSALRKMSSFTFNALGSNHHGSRTT